MARKLLKQHPKNSKEKKMMEENGKKKDMHKMPDGTMMPGKKHKGK